MSQEEPVIRILKLGNCPTLSGKGNLEYQVGHEVDGDILFRITANSGGGYFSGGWVPFKVIHDALEKAPKPLTSFALSSLYRGKSVNTPSFLFAALKQEGLVATDPEYIRGYAAVSPDDFMSEMTKLIDAGTDLKVPVKVTGKGVVKSSGPVLPQPSKGRPKKPKS